jgi:hypothetical protein
MRSKRHIWVRTVRSHVRVQEGFELVKDWADRRDDVSPACRNFFFRPLSFLAWIWPGFIFHPDAVVENDCADEPFRIRDILEVLEAAPN